MFDIFVEIFPRFILHDGRVYLLNSVTPVFVAHSIKKNTLTRLGIRNPLILIDW